MSKESYADDHFKMFAESLEGVIARYGDLSEETLLERQKRQIETLVDLEVQFRQALIRHSWGRGVYVKFIAHIRDERKNILTARPYFRERQNIFTRDVAKALRARNVRALYKFHINYTFITFVLKAKKWPPNGKIVKLANEIGQIRHEIAEMNMPLAISRARLFWSRTPRSHLSYMDLVQISGEGLLSAIDKFCLPYSPTFRAMAIGRMVGSFIFNYSETLIHFYPTDKKKLYRANKLVGRHAGEVNYDSLAEEINQYSKTKAGEETSSSEISHLMAAASCVSVNELDVNSDSEEGVRVSSNGFANFAADPSSQPDNQVEEADAQAAVRKVIRTLDPIEQKLLALKGVMF